MHDRLNPESETLPVEPQKPELRVPRTIIPPSPIGAAFGFFGIALPFFTLVFELLTHACAQEFFNPIPTWWHVALIAMIPVVNVLIWLALLHPERQPLRGLHFAAGASIGVSLVYSVLYLPMAPFAAVGILACGLGLLPLSPLFALISTFRATGKFVRAFGLGRTMFGFAAGVLALIVPHGWDVMTDNLMRRAVNGDAEERVESIQSLRRFGREQRILDRCYFTGQSPLMLFSTGGRPAINTENARALYYRVTGRSFNEEPAPTGARLGNRGRGIFNWDMSLGGDRVAGKVAGLSMETSSMEMIKNTHDLTTYNEWTFVFRNIAANASEARAQIELPPGGVVSRVTLWIDGKPCEAAFGGRSQVRAAYQEVAVVQRRDPVLVTTCGTDRILMQCFPVPANGGTMQVRIGVTAPIQVIDNLSGSVAVPRMIETNFEDADDLRTKLSMPRDGGAPEERAFAMSTLREGVTLPITLPSESKLRVTEDPTDPQFSIVQTLKAAEPKMPKELIYVVDGSGALAKHAAQIGKHLEEAKPRAIYFAGDVVTEWNNEQSFHDWWSAQSLAGGCDNLPALQAAWKRAAASSDCAVVWIHGPQPVELTDIKLFRAEVDQYPKGPVIYDVSIGGGADRISASLENAPWKRIPAASSLEARLQVLRESTSGLRKGWQIDRSRVTKDAVPADASAGSRHIARLWAKDEVDRLRQQAGTTPAAAKLATQMQLVTPVSGAVVLETKAQYDRHGLKPVDAETVPSIPEPASALLLASSAAMLAFVRRRRRA